MAAYPSDDDFIQHLIEQQQHELDALAVLSPADERRTTPGREARSAVSLAYTPDDERVNQGGTPVRRRWHQTAGNRGGDEEEGEEARIRAWQEEWATREAMTMHSPDPQVALSPQRRPKDQPAARATPERQFAAAAAALIPPPPALAAQATPGLFSRRFPEDGDAAAARDKVHLEAQQLEAQVQELRRALAEEQAKRRQVQMRIDFFSFSVFFKMKKNSDPRSIAFST
jgi:hypothetical protein